jgi:RecJ-like exonuclease
MNKFILHIHDIYIDMSTKIITHGDTDGVISATLIKLIEDGQVYFSHPHALLEDIMNFAERDDRIYILDIALDEKLWRKVVDILNKYGEKGKVIYFDHHPRPLEFRDSMFKNVTYVNESGRSTSEIVHEYYREKMPLEASRLALLGGIGDYSDETPYMRKLYSYWDKRMIYFEAGILSQALEASRRLHKFK